ncbi:ADP-ribose pyrophosphatase YjhB (NUDIX family) [Nocardia caishijiensis]|uniref:ADP-ribose pyrophosphatase YjhB (NUDIX family) n=1 Tax=Nocardia caishijiensis TaxID=184756 RepID=A0ABQ6YNY2_9NOCA|nr:ADP-ribose pyrophosphatase YjhB (NUDIX family) [Nocardia caishijiensis]
MSIDVVTLRCWDEDTGVRVGIAAREFEPFTGQLALPGVLLGRGERLAEAARRAVRDKLGVPDTAVVAVGQLRTFDEPHRDPRGPTLAIAMWAVVAAHEGPAEWVGFDEIPPLAFDHNHILETTRPALAALLWKDPAFTRALTGAEFPATRAVDLTTALHGARPDPANLNRTLAAIPGLRRTGERRRVRATGRPAVVWAFDEG